jgi:uncharacterized alkaline shock family protein YloU
MSSEKISSHSETTLETQSLSEEANSTIGDIKINHSVVATIVRLAALEVAGVHSVGGGFVDSLAEVFSKKESERGVRVTVDEQGDYVIQVRVIMCYGVELAKVASEIQEQVCKQVLQMTSNRVNRVDIIIDGVKFMDSNQQQDDSKEFSMHDHPHTD